MLHKYLISHHRELARDCRAKVADRFGTSDLPDFADHSVSLFIRQLTDALSSRPSAPPGDGDGGNDGNPNGRTPFPEEIGRSAALHGADLLRRGFTVDQVVHEYGDVCQAITEMAIDLDWDIDPDDFRILNGCLDNAIAGAVTAFAEGRQTAMEDREDEKHERLSGLREEHRRLVEIAIQAFTAMRSGSLGMGGATSALLMHALTELQSLSDQPLVDEDKTEAAASLRRESKRNLAS